MKLLFERRRSWQKLLTEGNSPVEIQKKDGRVTYKMPHGYITVIENSPWAQGAHSIYGFYVDEDQRGKGIGKQLVKIVVDAYPKQEISAQVSSLSSLKVFLDLGFRTIQDPSASFAKAKEIFNDNGGSLNVRLNSPEIERALMSPKQSKL